MQNPIHPSGELQVYQHEHPVQSGSQPKVSFWRKLGGGSLTISILVHAILLAVGLLLIIQVIPAPEQRPDPNSGGGGGDPSADSKVKTQQRKMMNNTAPRVAAAGVASPMNLPEPQANDMNALTNLSSGALSQGLGGSGAGSGKGPGTGPGFGPGSDPRMGTESPKNSPFGMPNPTTTALVGTFYDLKQTKDGRPTPLGKASNYGEITGGYRSLMHDFTKRGWNERQLAEYFQAPQKLFQTKIFVPSMNADDAPKAFGQEDIPGSRWVVVYRGSVTPPKTGRYRFVGAGDDVLAVRFGNRTVFDFGYESATADFSLFHHKGKLVSTAKDREFNHLRKDLAMPEPVEIRNYPGLSPRHSSDIGGLAAGLEFEAKAGTSYPIEILIGETPGGFFFGYLLIEEIGAHYQKTPQGDPILPLFRLDNEVPAVTQPGPPFDPNGPVWKLSGNRGRISI